MKTFVPVIAFETIPDSAAFLTSHRRLSFQLLGCLLQITVTQKSYVSAGKACSFRESICRVTNGYSEL